MNPAFDLLLHHGLQLLSHFRVAQHRSHLGLVQFRILGLLWRIFPHLFERLGAGAFVDRQHTESLLNLFAQPFGAVLRVHLRDHTSLGNPDVAQDGVVPSLKLTVAFLDPIDVHLAQLPVVAQFRIVEQLLTGTSHCSGANASNAASADSTRNVSGMKQQRVAIGVA